MLSFVDTPLDGRPRLPGRSRPPAPFALADAVLAESADAARPLGGPDVLVVTTGQQPGLFGGPLYTLYKALTARAMARTLEAAWQRPVVPVFWVAGDDHDFAEAAAVSWLATDGGEVRAALPGRPDDAPLVPMYREPLPPDVTALLDELERTTPPGPERDATLAWLRRHYRPGRSVAAAFGGALAELLAPLGIVCLDGSHPELKRAAWPVVREALARATDLDRLLVERHRQLGAVGADPGVKVGEGATLVMLEGDLGRDRLLVSGDGFAARRSGERFSLEEIEALARAAPARLSANVLLRPVVESATLPTVAYVAGPGELRYLELAAALYGPLGVTRQEPVPRWSGLLVEPRVTRTLEKLQLTLADVEGDGAHLEQRVARHLAPEGFLGALGDLRQSLDRGYERLVRQVEAIDPTLEKPARSAALHAAGGLDNLEKRVLQAVKRREADVLAQLQRLQAAVRPGGGPQERGLGSVGFLARYGSTWVPELARHIEAWLREALEALPASP